MKDLVLQKSTLRIPARVETNLSVIDDTFPLAVFYSTDGRPKGHAMWNGLLFVFTAFRIRCWVKGSEGYIPLPFRDLPSRPASPPVAMGGEGPILYLNRWGQVVSFFPERYFRSLETGGEELFETSKTILKPAPTVYSGIIRVGGQIILVSPECALSVNEKNFRKQDEYRPGTIFTATMPGKRASLALDHNLGIHILDHATFSWRHLRNENQVAGIQNLSAAMVEKDDNTILFFHSGSPKIYFNRIKGDQIFTGFESPGATYPVLYASESAGLLVGGSGGVTGYSIEEDGENIVLRQDRSFPAPGPIQFFLNEDEVILENGTPDRLLTEVVKPNIRDDKRYNVNGNHREKIMVLDSYVLEEKPVGTTSLYSFFPTEFSSEYRTLFISARLEVWNLPGDHVFFVREAGQSLPARILVQKQPVEAWIHVDDTGHYIAVLSDDRSVTLYTARKGIPLDRGYLNGRKKEKVIHSRGQYLLAVHEKKAILFRWNTRKALTGKRQAVIVPEVEFSFSHEINGPLSALISYPYAMISGADSLCLFYFQRTDEGRLEAHRSIPIPTAGRVHSCEIIHEQNSEYVILYLDTGYRKYRIGENCVIEAVEEIYVRKDSGVARFVGGDRFEFDTKTRGDFHFISVHREKIREGDFSHAVETMSGLRLESFIAQHRIGSR